MDYRGIFTLVFMCVLCVDARQVPMETKEVTVRAINSTAIHVSWKQPSSQEGGGMIRGYFVYYSENSDDDLPLHGSGQYIDTMIGEKREIVITGLKSDTAYIVSVSGYTRKGDGIRTRTKPIRNKQEPDVDECAVNTSRCLNGGTCVNFDGGFLCVCVNGWTGVHCETNIDDCREKPCFHGGTCEDRIGYYKCSCPVGKTGLRCHLDDACINSPCTGEGALCDTSPMDGKAICSCKKGWTGTDCGTEIVECGKESLQSPRNLRGEPKSPNEINVHWEHAADQDSIDSYTLYYNDSIGRHNGEVTITAVRTSCALTDLMPDTMYYIQLKARNRCGEIGNASIVQIRTPAYIPSEPTGVTIKSINSTAIHVSWNAPRREKGDGIIRGYIVYYTDDFPLHGSEQSMDIMDGEKTEIVITGLKPDTGYTVSVSGYTRKGDGIRSKPKRFRNTVESSFPQSAPFWSLKKDSVIYIAGPATQDITLDCSVRGQPKPTIEWFKEGQRVVPDDIKYKANSWKLRISYLSIQDKGNYTCVVTNSHGSITWTYTVDVIQKLAVAPIMDDVANITAVVGQNATFTCKILMSDAAPFLQWLKHYEVNGSFTDPEGNPHVNILQQSGYLKTIDDPQYLFLKNVTEDDEGWYSCIVVNSVGMNYRSAYLRVLDENLTHHCFRMYRRKKQTCGRYIEHQFAHQTDGLPKSINPEICCSSRTGGAGFSTTGLVKLKKNHFACTSCEEWRRSNE